MSKIIVLGAGLVGSAIAIDLSKQHEVACVDIDTDNLNKLKDNKNLSVIFADFTNKPAIADMVKDFDLVVGAVPGYLGFGILETVIEAKKNIVDISFFPEDAFKLDDMAKINGVIAVVDCGVAPGMSNMIVGYHNKKMIIKNVEIYVGGLPFIREYPYQYKAPFSPRDVIEEYTRPARLVENYKEISRKALSDVEQIFFEKVGTLEACNTDGLRSLIRTMKIPYMKEKTLRYPGHIQFIQSLIEAGFLNTEPIKFKGHRLAPIDFSTALMFDKWKLRPEDDEFTIMKVIVEGTDREIRKSFTYDLFDRKDKTTNISSMARTTGYTATAAANLVLNGMYKKPGISPPEYIGQDEDNFNYVLNYLIERGVIYTVHKEKK